MRASLLTSAPPVSVPAVVRVTEHCRGCRMPCAPSGARLAPGGWPLSVGGERVPLTVRRAAGVARRAGGRTAYGLVVVVGAATGPLLDGRGSRSGEPVGVGRQRVGAHAEDDVEGLSGGEAGSGEGAQGGVR